MRGGGGSCDERWWEGRRRPGGKGLGDSLAGAFMCVLVFMCVLLCSCVLLFILCVHLMFLMFMSCSFVLEVKLLDASTQIEPMD